MFSLFKCPVYKFVNLRTDLNCLNLIQITWFDLELFFFFFFFQRGSDELFSCVSSGPYIMSSAGSIFMLYTYFFLSQMCLVLSQQSILIICSQCSQRQRQQEVQRWNQKSCRPIQSYTCPEAAQWHQRSRGHLPRPSVWQSHQSAHAKGKEPGTIASPVMTFLALAQSRRKGWLNQSSSPKKFGFLIYAVNKLFLNKY